jgi:iron complex outermembrane receptor protein
MAYEAGINATFADNRVEVNLTGFYSDYTDMQVQRIVSIGSTIDNAGEASGGGAELEMRALLSETVSLNVGISVANMEFDAFLSADPVEPAAGIKDLAGNDLPRVAPFTGSASLNLAQPVGNGGMLNASFEVQHQGRIYFDQFNREINSQGAFTVINARVGYESPGEVWYVAAYGKNLTDKKYTESRFEIAELGGTVLAVIGPPVEYGVEVGYNF